ncbi:MAG: hypothetical protein KGL39_58890 [Patescibacteria group bacterium]|nr:hypothetical protein [Patescibacteria group bacterium]
MTREQAIEELREIGAELAKQEDASGRTRSGWWLDGVWLAPANNPVDALSAIRG